MNWLCVCRWSPCWVHRGRLANLGLGAPVIGFFSSCLMYIRLNGMCSFVSVHWGQGNFNNCDFIIVLVGIIFSLHWNCSLASPLAKPRCLPPCFVAVAVTVAIRTARLHCGTLHHFYFVHFIRGGGGWCLRSLVKALSVLPVFQV